MIGKVQTRLGVVGLVALIALISTGPFPPIHAQTQMSGSVARLAWYDRAGRRLATFGDAADYGDMDLSPDGRRVAVGILDATLGSRDIWIVDTTTGARQRLTSDRGDEAWSTWSPDGRRIVFNSTRNGTYDLYARPADGTGTEEEILVGGDPKWPVSWSADGRNILYVTSNAKPNQRLRLLPTPERPDGAPWPENDVWVIPQFGDRKPYPVLATTAPENWASFSPDGKWIAYSAIDADDDPRITQPDVYVMQFPPTGRKWQISTGGGNGARWRRDGKELFYLTPERTLVAAQVNPSGSNFDVVNRQVLFETKVASSPYRAFAVSADGQRILVNTTVVPTGGAPTNASVSTDRPGRLASR